MPNKSCYYLYKSVADSNAFPKFPKGILRSSAMFKIQFWASSWHEQKNSDLETEDPETIHASIVSFFQEFFIL